MILLRLLCLLCLCTANIRASSHWIVTETGLIQPKDESPFLMARPFDLLSFLNQETRWQNIFNIHDDLIMRQKRINTLWAAFKAEAEFSKHLAKNEYCRATGKIDEVNWYTTFLEVERLQKIPYMSEDIKDGTTEVPDCKKISSLTFSMSGFEHLEAMINRERLYSIAEPSIPEESPYSIDRIGHLASESLRKNATSWLHYNLATVYWRLKGNMPKAMECVRRAVHYAPRYYKYLPLFCMGSIFHWCQKTKDAIIILGASVDHNPQLSVSHLVLGQSYAIVGDFNNSLRHFNQSLKLEDKAAVKYRNGVLCHIDMLTKMQYAQRTIKRLSNELAKYSEVESMWKKIQIAFLKAMKEDKDADYKSVDWITKKLSHITNLKIKDIRKDTKRNSDIKYFIDSPAYSNDWLALKGVAAINTAFNLEKAIQSLEISSGGPTMDLLAENIQAPLNETQILEEIGPLPTFPDVFDNAEKFKPPDVKIKFYTKTKASPPFKPDIGKVLYPPNLRVSRNKEGFDTDPEWPSNEFCKEAAAKFPDNVEAIYPVYLPFENKGLSLKTLLTDRIGVSASTEYALPWHPPICPTDKDLATYTTKKGGKVQVVSETEKTNLLRPKLLNFLSTNSIDAVKKMQDAEIGHRIYIVMQKKLVSKWIVYTLSSLYWRVRGNLINALNCLLSASRTVEMKYKDMVLVSMASVLLEMGYIDDSSDFVEQAYKMNAFEPQTNFLIAQLSMIKRSHKSQLFHLKQAIRIDSRFMNGFGRNLLNAWSCILKQVNTLKELGDIDGDKDLCAEMEPGVSMVCERDGTNCHIKQSHCTTGTSKETSTLVRMLDLQDDNIQQDVVDDLDATYFNEYIITVPKKRTNLVGHQKSYNLMLNTVADRVNGCGEDGCNDVNLRDLDIKEEECSHQHLQLDYWLHVVGFKEQFIESDHTLPAEIRLMTSSTKKVPECRVPLDSNEDFFTPRILGVDTKDWEPVLSLMHQFTETFEYYDFAILGSKIAKFVEQNPASWLGAVAAGWWCGAGGRGACAARCAAAAHAHAPVTERARALTHLVCLLHMQSKHKDAKNMAYLAFYSSPKSKIEAFLVGVSHTYNQEYDEAVWMYRYAVSFDEKFLPAKACLHITMCLMLFGDQTKKKNYPPST